MPAKNIIKLYYPNSFYHVYNRGTDKRLVFLDHQDFLTLLSYFKLYLTSRRKLERQIQQFQLINKPPCINSLIKALNNNFANKIEIHAYTLMPNHYHLLLKQRGAFDMPQFLRTIFICYSYYFNTRHKRDGRLFQSAYRAKLIKTDGYFSHLARYIHLNSRALKTKDYPKYRPWQSYEDYPYSSCQHYLSNRLKHHWLTMNFLNSYFPSVEKHRQFLKNYHETQLNLIKEDILE